MPQSPYLVSRIRRDLRALGMVPSHLLKLDPKLTAGTVSRFFTGEVQSPKTAQRIAAAIGQPLSRYLRGGVE